jgi:hypothetical protein
VPEQHITYPPADRPAVEVLVDDTWWPSELRQRSQREDGSWWANASLAHGVSVTPVHEAC